MKKTILKGSNRLLLFLMHIVGWLLYSYWIYSNARQDSMEGRLFYTVYFLLPYSFAFYSILYFLVSYKNTGWLYKIIALLLVFIVTYYIAYGYFHMLPLLGRSIAYREGAFIFLRPVSIRFSVTLAAACIYIFVSQSISNRKTITQLREEMLERQMENIALKEREAKLLQDKMMMELAQLPPHFLYNTLTLLVSRAMEFNEQLANNIRQLSGIIRYSMECVRAAKNKVLLEEELNNLQSLIQINKARNKDLQNIAYKVEGNVHSIEVPPLSLITVVENAYKYGDFTDPKQPLEVKVQVFDDHVYFKCRNKKRRNAISVSSHKIGIANLQKQLDLSFKDKYHFHTQDEDACYTLELTINK